MTCALVLQTRAAWEAGVAARGQSGPGVTAHERACLASAIIVNWNGAEHLRSCLPSLREQSYEPLEIIVVDNASSDDSRAVAEQHGARWLPLAQNLGLAPAMNRGAAIARGERRCPRR